MTDVANIKASACRLCNFDGLEIAAELNDMPRWNHRLLKLDELERDHGVDIKIYRCSSCGFVSIPMNLSEDYYDDYINTPSLSAQAQQFQIDQANDFVGKYDLKGRTILEIGCGDGFFLQSMQEAGAICFGVEPSRAQYDLACSRGLKVGQETLSAKRIMAEGPFDAFVTRQVFEHVIDMRDFLLTIRENLRDGAVGLIEVPNLVKLIDEARFFDFIPEHVNYFAPHTLGLALQLAGFEVIDISPVQDGESLRAIVRWQSKAKAEYGALTLSIRSLRDEINSFLLKKHLEGKRVAIWGAGGKGLSMMAIADLSHIHLLVDGDPSKEGMLTPLSHLSVAVPSEIKSQRIDVVIVMAPAYEIEIAQLLMTELDFTGQIYFAGRGFELFEPLNLKM